MAEGRDEAASSEGQEKERWVKPVGSCEHKQRETGSFLGTFKDNALGNS